MTDVLSVNSCPYKSALISVKWGWDHIWDPWQRNIPLKLTYSKYMHTHFPFQIQHVWNKYILGLTFSEMYAFFFLRKTVFVPSTVSILGSQLQWVSVTSYIMWCVHIGSFHVKWADFQKSLRTSAVLRSCSIYLVCCPIIQMNISKIWASYSK